MEVGVPQSSGALLTSGGRGRATSGCVVSAARGGLSRSLPPRREGWAIPAGEGGYLGGLWSHTADLVSTGCVVSRYPPSYLTPHPVRFAHSNPVCEFGVQKLQSAPRNYTYKVPLQRPPCLPPAPPCRGTGTPLAVPHARGSSWREGRMALLLGLPGDRDSALFHWHFR